MIVNGENIEIGNKRFVIDLIKEFKLNPERIVIEIDEEIIHNEDFESYELKQDNTIEVISFVGGG